MGISWEYPWLKLIKTNSSQAELRVSSSGALDAASASMLLEAFAPLRLGQRWLSTLQGRMEPQLVPGGGWGYPLTPLLGDMDIWYIYISYYV